MIIIRSAAFQYKELPEERLSFGLDRRHARTFCRQCLIAISRCHAGQFYQVLVCIFITLDGTVCNISFLRYTIYVMKKTYLNVEKEFCGECSLALMHYIGNMEGVDSITAENGKVAVEFDDSKIREESLMKLTRETIERLGYKIVEGDISA